MDQDHVCSEYRDRAEGSVGVLELDPVLILRHAWGREIKDVANEGQRLWARR
jgi:hypothetical protein